MEDRFEKQGSDEDDQCNVNLDRGPEPPPRRIGDHVSRSLMRGVLEKGFRPAVRVLYRRAISTLAVPSSNVEAARSAMIDVDGRGPVTSFRLASAMPRDPVDHVVGSGRSPAVL